MRWQRPTSKRSIVTMPKALADHWSPDAVYLNRTTGEEVVGRAAIAEQFRTLLEEQPELKLEVNVESIQFISPSVAVEHGRTTLLAPNAEPEEIDYTAVDVKRDGKWLLDRVTDTISEIVPSHYEQLKALEWMVGEWTGTADNAEVELDCNWTKNQNFLTRAFKISLDDGTDLSGMQADRLGSGGENDSLLDLRFQRHVCGGDLGTTRRPLVPSQSRHASRWSYRNHDQRDETNRCQLVHLADDRTYGRR